MTRDLVTPEVGKTILVHLPRYSGPYDLGHPTAIGKVKVIRRYYNFAGNGPSGFLGALCAQAGQAPRGRRLAFLDEDIAYCDGNFIPEPEN